MKLTRRAAIKSHELHLLSAKYYNVVAPVEVGVTRKGETIGGSDRMFEVRQNYFGISLDG